MQNTSKMDCEQFQSWHRPGIDQNVLVLQVWDFLMSISQSLTDRSKYSMGMYKEMNEDNVPSFKAIAFLG